MLAHWWMELSLGPLVCRLLSRGCLEVAVGSRKSLESLSVDEWGCVPARLLFVLRPPSTGGYRPLGRARSWCQNVRI